MTNRLIAFLLILNASIIWGQNKDYVILNSTNASKADTVFGDILFPKNGIIAKVKIMTPDGKKKYCPNDVIGFKYGDRYFASVPFNSKNNTFAEKKVDGKIDLYYYNSGPNAGGGGITGATATYLTSYYYIKPDTSGVYIKVPHSREKAKNKIAELFKDNEEIYNQILSNEFRIWKLPEIVKKYNREN